MPSDRDGPYSMKVTLWERPPENPDDDWCRDERVVEGFYDEPSPIDAVNALLYDMRGQKSSYELAYIDEIEEAGDE